MLHSLPKKETMIPEKDLIIISHLRQNARQHMKTIAEKTGIPLSTVHDRIKTYEKKALRKHTTLFDFTKLGFNAKVNIAFKAGKETREALQDFLAEHPSTNTLYRTNNTFDFLGEFIFTNLNEAYVFAEDIEKQFNAQTQMMNVIEEIKKEEFLAKRQP